MGILAAGQRDGFSTEEQQKSFNGKGGAPAQGERKQGWVGGVGVLLAVSLGGEKGQPKRLVYPVGKREASGDGRQTVWSTS